MVVAENITNIGRRISKGVVGNMLLDGHKYGLHICGIDFYSGYLWYLLLLLNFVFSVIARSFSLS